MITPEEVVSLGRPIGKVDDTKLLAYITEVEQMNIKPILGDELFMQILAEGQNNDLLKTLLNGGSYQDSTNQIRTFVGLRTAMSYFVYAQNVMSGDFHSTRYGMRLKEGDYSTGISSKERSECYNNALEVGQHYLKDCVAFCRAKKLIRGSRTKGIVSTGGCTIRRIG